jgi:hypothetical protein
MKLSRLARVKKNLATAAEVKKVVAATRVLFDFHLISGKKATMIARTFGYRGPTLR